jgi:hypothetical protein
VPLVQAAETQLQAVLLWRMRCAPALAVVRDYLGGWLVAAEVAPAAAAAGAAAAPSRGRKRKVRVGIHALVHDAMAHRSCVAVSRLLHLLLCLALLTPPLLLLPLLLLPLALVRGP